MPFYFSSNCMLVAFIFKKHVKHCTTSVGMEGQKSRNLLSKKWVRIFCLNLCFIRFNFCFSDTRSLSTSLAIEVTWLLIQSFVFDLARVRRSQGYEMLIKRFGQKIMLMSVWGRSSLLRTGRAELPCPFKQSVRSWDVRLWSEPVFEHSEGSEGHCWLIPFYVLRNKFALCEKHPWNVPVLWMNVVRYRISCATLDTKLLTPRP